MVMRRVRKKSGRLPSLDSFPLLDAPTLRPYNRFTDPAMYDVDVLTLVRSSFSASLGSSERLIGCESFFDELDRLLTNIDGSDVNNPFPIAHRRHPRLVHSHPYMGSIDNLPHVEELVRFHMTEMDGFSLPHNSLHVEWRSFLVNAIYLLGRLELAAAYGDLVTCVDCLDLIDSVTTSLRGLCEVEYLA